MGMEFTDLTEEELCDLMCGGPEDDLEEFEMVKVRVLYGKLFETTWQEKSFKDENAAVEWIRRNADKIGCINDYRTGFKPVSHFEIMDALRGVAN